MHMKNKEYVVRKYSAKITQVLYTLYYIKIETLYTTV